MVVNDVQRGYSEYKRDGLVGTLYSTAATTIDTYINAGTKTVGGSLVGDTLNWGVFVQTKTLPATDTNQWATEYCQAGVSRTGTGNSAANAVPDSMLGATIQSRDRVTQSVEFSDTNDNYRFGGEVPVVSRGEIRMKVKQFASSTNNVIAVGGRVYVDAGTGEVVSETAAGVTSNGDHAGPIPGARFMSARTINHAANNTQVSDGESMYENWVVVRLTGSIV